MKMTNRKLIVAVCAILIMTVSGFGTLAYLTDEDTAVNTFTVGDVDITLDEADVKLDGTLDSADRVYENEYELLPGRTYIKDPTVTVVGGSESAYVRMMVTVNYSSQLDAIFAPEGVDLKKLFNGYDDAEWKLQAVTEDAAANTRTYEFRYKEVVAKSESDTKLAPLFESFTVPGEINNEQLASLVTKGTDGEIVDQFKITVVAHAMQAPGFEGDEAGAWAAFGVQNS